ncbi:MAG: hypothetical protein U0176_19870 [Bacteroidia bacterium]
MATQSDSPVIAVLVEQMHPRVCYTLETVLGEFLGMKPMIIEPGDAKSINHVQLHGLLSLHYGRSPHPTLPNLPCNGLLYEDTIRPAGEGIDWNGRLSEQLEATDFLAMIFHRLTQYELLRPGAAPNKDGHGRYLDEGEGFSVHGFLEQFVAMLPAPVQALVRWPEFDYEVTIDVDQPWKYLHKPVHVRWGGLLRDLLRGGAGERWRALRANKDPSRLGHSQAPPPSRKDHGASQLAATTSTTAGSMSRCRLSGACSAMAASGIQDRGASQLHELRNARCDRCREGFP